jgi:hypothetical protein
MNNNEIERLKEKVFEKEGYNPRIAFKRTKTLMEGDDYCDHFYGYREMPE